MSRLSIYLLQYVLTYITRLKEEQHEVISNVEMAVIQEVEKQNKLQIKMWSFQQAYDIPSKDLENLRLSQDMDRHIGVYFFNAFNVILSLL